MSRPWTVATSTPLHCEILARAASHADGARIRGVGPNTAAHTLQLAGLGRLAETSPGGYFIINAAGRAVLREALVHADAKAEHYLDKTNKARGKGQADKAWTFMGEYHAWLDAANLLRQANDASNKVTETGRQRIETPELNRMKAVRERSQAIGQFIDWLREEKRIVLAEQCESDFIGECGLVPCNTSIERLLADHFGIDLQKVEAERRALLDDMRQRSTS